jgi:glycosyltransferase involved in cell wall biosynthesis
LRNAPRILVLIPAYNESPRIGRVVRDLAALEPKPDILVIDDGSADGTADAARAAGARAVSHPFNLGYGAALQTGYRYALAREYDLVVQMDGDGQHPAAFVPSLLQPLLDDRADVVIGSRFLGGDSYPVPWPRRVGIRLFRALARVAVGQRVRDVTSGFQAVNRAAMRVFASDIFPPDFPDADVLMILTKLGLRLAEYPVRMEPSPDKTSMHAGLGILYYVVKMTLSVLIIATTGADSLRRDLP